MNIDLRGNCSCVALPPASMQSPAFVINPTKDRRVNNAVLVHVFAYGLRLRLSSKSAQCNSASSNSVADDIIQSGWPVGKVLGSEEQLLARYGVGRGVLREAVRVLEMLGVARRRQGPGGGLVVVAPQTDVILDTARLFLDFRGTQLGQLYDVWIVLEGLAIRDLAPKLMPENLAVLRETLAREEAWDAETGGATRDRPNIHVEIAKLAGNPVIELFLETIFLLAVGHGMPAMSTEGAAWLRAEHALLVSAIAEGDLALAQTRVRRIVEQVARNNPADA